MTKILLPLSAVAVFVFASFVGFGSSSAPEGSATEGAAESATAPQDDKDTELAGHFKGINKAYRKLRVTVKKTDRAAESLEKVREIQALALQCKVGTPHYAQKIPAAERAQFMVDYQKQVIELIRIALDLEVAVLEGRSDDAEELVKKLYGMKTPSHKKFRDLKEGD